MKIKLVYIEKKRTSTKSLSKKYNIWENIMNYMVSLRAQRNKEHPKYKKEEAITRVLINGQWLLIWNYQVMECYKIG